MRTNFSVPSSEAAEVAKETGAKIVLSSDWRSSPRSRRYVYIGDEFHFFVPIWTSKIS